MKNSDQSETMKKTIHKWYYHIDNGGVTIELFDSSPDEEGTFDWLQISESFFGYATGSLTFHNHGPEFVRKFGLALIEAASKLEQYSKEKMETHVQS